MVCTVTRRFLVLFIAGLAFGQTPAFEVASVKRDASGGNGGETRVSRAGVFTARNSSLQALIRYAYDVRDVQIQGPAWMATERYDIEAKAGDER